MKNINELIKAFKGYKDMFFANIEDDEPFYFMKGEIAGVRNVTVCMTIITLSNVEFDVNNGKNNRVYSFSMDMSKEYGFYEAIQAIKRIARYGK